MLSMVTRPDILVTGYRLPDGMAGDRGPISPNELLPALAQHL
jgi:hypothetical protein